MTFCYQLLINWKLKCAEYLWCTNSGCRKCRGSVIWLQAGLEIYIDSFSGYTGDYLPQPLRLPSHQRNRKLMCLFSICPHLQQELPFLSVGRTNYGEGPLQLTQSQLRLKPRSATVCSTTSGHQGKIDTKRRLYGTDLITVDEGGGRLAARCAARLRYVCSFLW